MSLLFAVETFSLLSGSALVPLLRHGLTGASRLLLGLALFHETGGLVDHEHLFVLLLPSFHNFEHSEQLICNFLHPIHVVIHDKTIVRWGSEASTIFVPIVGGIPNSQEANLST